MRKGKSIIGLKVLSQSDGADLGNVKDLIFDHETDELLALLISDKELFGLIDAQIVPWSQVRNIGPDAIVVPSAESKIRAHDDARVSDIMDRQTALSGTRIFSTEGQNLGTLADMYVDEETGRVIGYEISTGFISDTMSGKRYLPAHGDLAIGEDVALVPPEAAAELEAQAQNEPGGLKATASSVGEKVSGVYSTAKDKVTDVYGNIATASVEKQKEFVVGKTASRDVVIPADKATMAAPSSFGNVSSNAASTHVSDATMSPTLADPTTPPSSTLASSSELAPSTGVSTTSGLPATSGLSTSSSMGTSSMGIPGEMATSSAPVEPVAHDISSTGDSVNGEVLVRNGEVITREHADRAEAAGVLGQLVLAAGGGVASGAISSGSTTASGHAAGLQDRAEEAAIGRPAGREVVAPNGTTIVAPGMVITREILDQARLYGKEREVIAAAGIGAASAGVGTVTEHAAGVWDTIKQKAAELTGAAQDKKAEYNTQAEQNRINNALGRPVTRVILDQSDNVILNTGDLITHAAIEHARTAGALEILLDSVYTADPEITPEMLRAREPGQDALPTQAQPTGGPITATVAPGASGNAVQDSPSQPVPGQGGNV
ncbi:MAG TPA: PRC-barrel domain-containing protein [Abditibacteriaceae bacterium]|jgi:uncharacterized protein YrrD